MELNNALDNLLAQGMQLIGMFNPSPEIRQTMIEDRVQAVAKCINGHYEVLTGRAAAMDSTGPVQEYFQRWGVQLTKANAGDARAMLVTQVLQRTYPARLREFYDDLPQQIQETERALQELLGQEEIDIDYYTTLMEKLEGFRKERSTLYTAFEQLGEQFSGLTDQVCLWGEVKQDPEPE